ncbi:MAG: hypothetical protein H6602_12490 [Flavobacteriales bacterium]|nr:SiaB family protein kinase [Flavobacteriales bacterium]MCB9192474.1 hypothetical protein [Flavobacteriales bacterium]
MSVSPKKYALIDGDSVLLEYEGQVSKEILLDTLPKIEDQVDALGVSKQTKRKIVNIAIETLQNLQLHSMPLSDSAHNHHPLFVLSKTGNSIAITIGNLILNSECKLLKDKLDKINSLNEEEVKFLYGVIMKQTVVKFSTKGGAGLGLIDMKKKSGNNLKFDFQPLDDKVTYFSLKVTVPMN